MDFDLITAKERHAQNCGSRICPVCGKLCDSPLSENGYDTKIKGIRACKKAETEVPEESWSLVRQANAVNPYSGEETAGSELGEIPVIRDFVGLAGARTITDGNRQFTAGFSYLPEGEQTGRPIEIYLHENSDDFIHGVSLYYSPIDGIIYADSMTEQMYGNLEELKEQCVETSRKIYNICSEHTDQLMTDAFMAAVAPVTALSRSVGSLIGTVSIVKGEDIYRAYWELSRDDKNSVILNCLEAVPEEIMPLFREDIVTEAIYDVIESCAEV